MIIGFLGKGGSGKSSLSHHFVTYLARKGIDVLAVDADHNMDLAYRLGAASLPYFGTSLSFLKNMIGLKTDDNYRAAFDLENEPVFSLEPKDAYTQAYSMEVSDRITVMAAGPHTDDILEDKSCSHILFTPLKIYLPFLSLKDNQVVVVDEKAGADGAGTGVSSGFDLAVIVSEPTEYGAKAAKQIAELLDHYGTPYVFAGNKIMDEEDATFTKNHFPDALLFPFEKSWMRAGEDTLSSHAGFEMIIEKAKDVPQNRKERSKQKYDR